MNKEYTQGFIDKCAEAGVDPEQLVKTAARGDMLIKKLGPLLKTHEFGPSAAGRLNMVKQLKGGAKDISYMTPEIERKQNVVMNDSILGDLFRKGKANIVNDGVSRPATAGDILSIGGQAKKLPGSTIDHFRGLSQAAGSEGHAASMLGSQLGPNNPGANTRIGELLSIAPGRMGGYHGSIGELGSLETRKQLQQIAELITKSRMVRT